MVRSVDPFRVVRLRVFTSIKGDDEDNKDVGF